MSPDTIFAQAIEIASAMERAAFLEGACAGDPGLRREVERLVRDHFRAGDFLEQPAARLVATVDEQVGEGPGAVIGPYKLMEQIGEGGFGLVFVAEQQQPVRRKVALKVIKPGMDSRQVVARFEAERQALALMDHPNIAKVLDGGATPAGRPYFVMELVRGAPVTEFCDEHRLSPRERLGLFVAVCNAVQHAHQKGIIHRDLKPSNVMVADHDGNPVVKIIDFGIAKAMGQRLTEKTLYTNFTQMVGTPTYMSPEQAGQSGLDIDTRTDIYSLGVLLYELLTGTTPFDREQLETLPFDEVRRIIREVEPARPSARLSTVGEAAATASSNRQTDQRRLSRLVRGELDWIVMKCLEKDRTRRYDTASGLARDVEQYLRDEPVLAGPPSAGYRLRKYARKHKKMLATAAAFAVLLVAATATSIGLASWALRERSHAEAQKRAAEANFKRALDAVEHMLTRVADVRLAHVPQMETVRRDLLQDALKFYQDFLAEKGDSPLVRSEAARAYKRVGDIQVSIGNRDEGEAAYRQAVTLLEKLLDESPGDPTLLGELAEASTRLALVYHGTQRSPQAKVALQRAVSLLEQGDAARELTLENRRTLAGIYNNAVVVYRQTGDLDLAETAFARCKALAENMLAEDPKDLKTLLILAGCHQNVGLVYGAKGNHLEAEAAHKKALGVYRDLTRFDPDDVSHRKKLASSYNNLALMYDRTRQYDKAKAALYESLALHESLHRDHPKVVEFAVDLGGNYGNLATLIRRMGAPEESLEWTAKAIGLAEPVLKQDPRYAPARMFLFDTLMGRGYAYVRLNRRDDAVKDWRRMLEISESQSDIRMRIYRPFACVFLGEHARATAEIEGLLTDGHANAYNLLMFAEVHSLSAAAAAKDDRLPPAERDKLADKYGRRTVELLRQAQAAGYFRDADRVSQLRDDKDLEAIRARADFQQLLADLGNSAKPTP